MRTLNNGRRGRCFASSTPTRSRTSPASVCLGHAHEVAERSGVRSCSSRSACRRSTARSTSRARMFARAAIRETATSPLPTWRPTGSPEAIVALGFDPADRRRSARLAADGAGTRARGQSSRRTSSSSAGSDWSRRASEFGRVSRRGMIHGRFQPFPQRPPRVPARRGERSDEVWIGITNPDPERIKPEAQRPAAPPARVEPVLLRRAAADGESRCRRARGSSPCAVHAIPFPVNEPELWPAYVARSVTQYHRGSSPPGAGPKLDRLREAGYEVVILDQGAEKEISGADVRPLYATAATRESLVPRA